MSDLFFRPNYLSHHVSHHVSHQPSSSSSTTEKDRCDKSYLTIFILVTKIIIYRF
jgi:hypothetical protein